MFTALLKLAILAAVLTATYVAVRLILLYVTAASPTAPTNAMMANFQILLAVILCVCFRGRLFHRAALLAIASISATSE